MIATLTKTIIMYARFLIQFRQAARLDALFPANYMIAGKKHQLKIEFVSQRFVDERVGLQKQQMLA